MKNHMRGAGALLAALTLVGVVSTTTASAAPRGATRIYSSVPAQRPRPGNIPSEGPEAYAYKEMGNQIVFAGSNRRLKTATVTMSTWACTSGHWNTKDCVSKPGANFRVPITLNIYKTNTDGVHAGTLVASATQTFALAYRPSASARCTGSDAGKWYDAAFKACRNGMAVDITFSFNGVTVPNEVVYGISFNSTHYGPSPIGESAPCFTSSGGCPYDSLNLGLSNSSIDLTVGSNSHPGTLFQNSPFGSEYCDGGSAGTNQFRLDSPSNACWGTYIPAVQFSAIS